MIPLAYFFEKTNREQHQAANLIHKQRAPFLRFRAPINEFFSEQAVHSFQLKLLKQQINRAEKGR